MHEGFRRPCIRIVGATMHRNRSLLTSSGYFRIRYRFWCVFLGESVGCLFLVRDLALDGSVSRKQIEIDRLFEMLGGIGNVLLLEIDLALSGFVVSRADVVVVDLQGEDHVVEGGNVEGEGFVPDGVNLALLRRGDLCSVVLVANLEARNGMNGNGVRLDMIKWEA